MPLGPTMPGSRQSTGLMLGLNGPFSILPGWTTPGPALALRPCVVLHQAEISKRPTVHSLPCKHAYEAHASPKEAPETGPGSEWTATQQEGDKQPGTD